jgi:hypothetical protein
MDDVQPLPTRWQYCLVWTPGPVRSSLQLWAVSSQGRRTLWDSWEAEGFPETPSLSAVLHNLYCGSLDAQERSSHRA